MRQLNLAKKSMTLRCNEQPDSISKRNLKAEMLDDSYDTLAKQALQG